jgi:hypothetical protein
MADYTHVGTLRSGTHTVVELNKTFAAGDEVPLTETGATVFADKFDNIRKAKTTELKALEKELS